MSDSSFDPDKPQELHEMAPEIGIGTITESGLDGAAKDESIAPEKRSLARKISSRIKTRVKNYILNLDPRGKDKFWWTGNLLNAGVSSYIYLATGAPLLIKSLVTAGINIGAYAEGNVNKRSMGNYSADELTSRTGEIQDRYKNGTSRLRRFLLGVSAGGAYAAAVGIPLSVATMESVPHPIQELKDFINKDEPNT